MLPSHDNRRRGGGGGRPAAGRDVGNFMCLLLLSVFIFSASVVRGQTVADVVVFDLVAVNGSVAPSGVMAIELGSSSQKLNVLASFYTSSDAAVQVPSQDICNEPDGDQIGSTGGGWNTIVEPREGDFVRVNAEEDDDGFRLVKWKNSGSSSTINLSLRKGKGNGVRNVSSIATGIPNDGEFPWNANKTFTQAKLKDDADYSLMIWTESPPQRSISKYFSLGNSNNFTKSSVSPEYKACLQYLRAHGGYYNQTPDEDFRISKIFQDSFSNTNTSYKGTNSAVGITSLDWVTQDPVSLSASKFALDDLTVNLISQSSLGMGMIGLTALQTARGAKTTDMNVVSMNLGTENRRGSVVLGGYDSSLIDNDQKAVFAKVSSASTFTVVMSGIQFIGNKPGGSDDLIFQPNGKENADFVLAYDSPGIRLSRKVLDALLVLIGSPTFDEQANAYFYPQGVVAKSDYSLRFTMTNGTRSLSIAVPATSLLTTESVGYNPLTSRNETGRTYLQISQTPDGGPTGSYLGRSFLKYVYLIDSPATIGKFHLSGLPSAANPQSQQKAFVAASSSSLGIFNSDKKPTFRRVDQIRDSPGVGPMVGGIVGGVVALIGTMALFIFIHRRRSRKNPQNLGVVRFAGDTESSLPSFDKETGVVGIRHSGTGGTGTSGDSGPARSGSTTMFENAPPPRVPRPTVASLPPLRCHSDPQPPPAARRHSELRPSPLARNPFPSSTPSTSSVTLYDNEETSPHRTATIGRIFSGTQVSQITSFHSSLVSSPASPPETPGYQRQHARSISLGRVYAGTDIGIINSPSSTCSPSDESESESKRKHKRQGSGVDSGGSTTGTAETETETETEMESDPGPGQRTPVPLKRGESTAEKSDTSSAVFGLENVRADSRFVDKEYIPRHVIEGGFI